MGHKRSLTLTLYQRLTIFLFLPLNLLAQERPSLHCPTPLYDFGTQPNHETISHQYTLYNKGKAPLIIKKITSSCDCTTAKISSTTILPKSKAFLQATLHLKGREGEQRKYIYLESNDPHHPQFELTLKGKAVAEITVNPKRLFFLYQSNKQKPHTLTLRNKSSHPFKILKITSTLPHLTWNLETLTENKELQLSLYPKFPESPCLLKGKLTLQSTHPLHQHIQVPFSIKVPSPIATLPEQIILSQKNKKTPLRQVTIYSPSQETFKITHIEASKKIKRKLENLGNSRYRLKLLDLKADQQIEKETIEIHTDHPKTPILSLSFKLIEKNRER